MRHLLPPLPYDVSSLEPHIDRRTMIVHHEMHHAGYVRALNEAVASGPELLAGKSAEWLLLNLSKVPESMRATIRNNVGGHINHSLLWTSMSPQGGKLTAGPLADAIEHAFDSLEHFQNRFNEAGASLFGSGWVWLVKPRQGDERLQVITTNGHDNPLTQGYVPLLVNDVWEHAYYLKHENRRPEYLKGWWSIVNWQEVSQRFAQTLRSEETLDEVSDESLYASSR